jgi:tRNA A-37 threonylcarbamoyl transferase component Bud32/CheY-like chemotaxis protein
VYRAAYSAHANMTESLEVLVIDDDPDFRALVKLRLEQGLAAVNVVEYDPEREGRPGADFDWSHFDCVLLDYDLGKGETGLDWLEECRQPPDFPAVILLTAVVDAYVAVRAIKLGAEHYLIKADANSKQLVSLVQTSVEQRKAAQNQHRASVVKTNTPEIPGYTMIDIIGRGATSRVYSAKRHADGFQVVLKVLAMESHEESVAMQRFRREFELVCALDSPYIVRLYDLGVFKRNTYIVMEHLPGGDLKDRIRKGIEPQSAVGYLTDIAQGLKAVHTAGLVHRDLKPSNIMFRDNGDLVLSDFGLSRDEEADLELTVTGEILGTPMYMSPEQGNGDVADARSDLYSTGVIFFEMLTGTRPFTAPNAPFLIYQHLHAKVPGLPVGLMRYQALIEGLMTKDPADRVPSARALLDAIEAL